MSYCHFSFLNFTDFTIENYEDVLLVNLDFSVNVSLQAIHFQGRLLLSHESTHYMLRHFFLDAHSYPTYHLLIFRHRFS